MPHAIETRWSSDRGICGRPLAVDAAQEIANADTADETDAAKPPVSLTSNGSNGTMRQWVNFIMKGDPNGGTLPKWPEYKNLTNGKVMVFADSPQVETATPATKLQFYTAAYQRMLRNGTN